MKYTFSLLFFICFAFISRGQSPCEPNIDFENGNLNNWKLSLGTCCPIFLAPVAGPAAGRHTITTGVTTDLFGGFPVVDPYAGVFSLKLGNDINGAQAEGADYYIHVPSSSSKYSLIFRYAVVFEDPNHSPTEQPRFEVKAYDSATGDPIACAQYTFISSSTLPGFTPSTVQNGVIYKPWASANVDLSAANGKTVVISFSTGDCGLGGHFGYAYVDVACGLFETYGIDCLDGNKTTLSAPPGYQSYQWWDNNFTMFQGNGQTIQIATPTAPTTFAVVVTPFPGFGCIDTFYTTRSGSNLTVNAGKDTTICLITGTKLIPLNANANSTRGPIAYQWSPATGLSCTNCQSPTATIVSGSATYVVTVTDSSRCVMRDTVKILAAPNVFTNLKTDKDTICQNEEMWVNNMVSNPAGTKFYWYSDTSTIKEIDTNGRVKMSWSTIGRKKIIVRVFNSECEIFDSTYVYVKYGPTASFEMKKNGCLNEQIEIIPKKEPASYHWLVDGHTISDTAYKQKIYLNWNDLGNKKLRLTLIGHNGCLPKPFDASVYIHENPEADIAAVTKERICIGDKITLLANKNTDYTYDWKPSEYFESNNYHEVVLSAERPMTVSLEVSNRWNCRTSDSVYINAGLCCKVIIPDAFTPNGDGLNDKIHAIGIQNHKIHTFIIKNRWGQTMFETNNNNDAWDGTIKGKKQPTGTYVYYLKYICNDGEQIEMKGTFHLLN